MLTFATCITIRKCINLKGIIMCLCAGLLSCALKISVDDSAPRRLYITEVWFVDFECAARFQYTRIQFSYISAFRSTSRTSNKEANHLQQTNFSIVFGGQLVVSPRSSWVCVRSLYRENLLSFAFNVELYLYPATSTKFLRLNSSSSSCRD